MCVRVCVSVWIYILDIDRLTTLRISVSARGFVMQAVHSCVYVYASYVHKNFCVVCLD